MLKQGIQSFLGGVSILVASLLYPSHGLHVDKVQLSSEARKVFEYLIHACEEARLLRLDQPDANVSQGTFSSAIEQIKLFLLLQIKLHRFPTGSSRRRGEFWAALHQ